jgi:hypothetical protein
MQNSVDETYLPPHSFAQGSRKVSEGSTCGCLSAVFPLEPGSSLDKCPFQSKMPAAQPLTRPAPVRPPKDIWGWTYGTTATRRVTWIRQFLKIWKNNWLAGISQHGLPGIMPKCGDGGSIV